MARLMKKKQTFSLEKPDAKAVQVVGDFSDWEKRPIALKKQKNGLWKATVSLPPGTYQYRFVVDGCWQDDPACSARVPNPFGEMNCVREVG
jgi:1,4-alpha-glucan branching enzyme